MRADWTVPFDDLLTQRWLVCIFCGQAADRVELRSRAQGDALTMGLCARCTRSDATRARRRSPVASERPQRVVFMR
jgi:hypothetical protein